MFHMGVLKQNSKLKEIYFNRIYFPLVHLSSGSAIEFGKVDTDYLIIQ